MDRRRITISGRVQGVGFRPFVHRLATSLSLSGWVRNDGGQVEIAVQGQERALERFIASVRREAPPLARIDRLESRYEAVVDAGSRFTIVPSAVGRAGDGAVVADAATCDDCLQEVLDPFNRRSGYAFINCTNCGPRLTILRSMPYDRARTTMASFEMCAACRREYEDPADRRFHAEATCCPDCGPRLWLTDRSGQPVEADPISTLARLLEQGAIAAIKGLGGFHLACDASNDHAVRELRRRKRRHSKPFGVMVADLASAQSICQVDVAERRLLLSPAAPIVLLQRRNDRGGHDGISEHVAPNDNPRVGVMRAYTPLHHLLLRALGGRALVMTSGNASDEPIAISNEDALSRLGKIADCFLLHNRDIHVRCDDSVIRVTGAGESSIRIGRGLAPLRIPSPVSFSEPVLAVGGQLKGAFAIGLGHGLCLSHHLGDLDHPAAQEAFVRDIELYQQTLRLHPRVIAHDLHPDYASTIWAKKRALDGARLVPVQHHHAHVAACMAEHGLTGEVIGVSFDGAGFGADGTIWGGEILVAGYGHFHRAAHLRPVAMPGGDAASRQGWRMAVAHVLDAGEQLSPLEAAHGAERTRVIARMSERRVNAPMTSSAGRLFDAAAAILGVRSESEYEGHAAAELEWIASASTDLTEYAFDQSIPAPGAPVVLDTRPLIRGISRDIAGGVKSAHIARRFHATLASMVGAACSSIASTTNLNRVVLTGGVFHNELLRRLAVDRLKMAGLSVFFHRHLPCGDGGLALGQAVIAGAALNRPLAGASSFQSEPDGFLHRFNPLGAATCPYADG